MRHRIRILFFVVVIFLMLFSPAVWAVRPASRIGTNPTAFGTVPPSSQLVRSANPINTSGNLLITGNVSGGKHFRGVVPYQSTWSFGGPGGPSSVESFLRYSAGAEDYKSYSGGYKPYYSYTRMVTTTRPGYRSVFAPPVMGVDGRATSSGTIRIFAARPIGQLLSEQDTVSAIPDEVKEAWESSSDVGFRAWQMQRGAFGIPRPMSVTARQLQEAAKELSPTYEHKDRHAEQIRQLRSELNQVSDKAIELEQNLINQDNTIWELSLGPRIQLDSSRGKSQTRQDEYLLDDGRLLDAGTDIYEHMKQQIAELAKQLDALRKHRKASRGESQGLRAEVAQPAKEITDSSEQPSKEEGQSLGLLTERGFQKRSSALEGLSDAEVSARAKTILGEHKTFASFSKDKFNQHLRAAEEYLKQGKFYRAADAYTLASIYKPGDPLAYAGKSHALFAAGEYMSSALFLARALEIFPEYARFKIDIEAMLGDRDKLESRIADVEQWLEKSKAPELQFLLGYVYYQMGRGQRAARAIDAAYENMPESAAVATLKKVINEATKQ